MALFGRRKQKRPDPPPRDLAGDAAAMRDALAAMQAERGGAGGEIDLRAIVRDLLGGEVAAPTSDVSALVGLHTSPDDFYAKEVRPSWEGLSELQRAQRLDGFIELSAMLDAGAAGAGLPAEMSAVVHTKTLLLAWAFDETYGYLSRLARGRPVEPEV
jgi:hypothetical protein